MRGRTYIATSHHQMFQFLLENPKIMILDNSSIRKCVFICKCIIKIFTKTNFLGSMRYTSKFTSFGVVSGGRTYIDNFVIL